MRLWELDVLRGVAIIVVILFHAVNDLIFFTNSSCTVFLSDFLFIRKGAAIFIFLSGLVATIRYNKDVKRDGFLEYIGHVVSRGRVLVFAAILVSLATWLFDPERVVYFGILHFLVCASFLSLFFIRLCWSNMFVSLLFFVPSFFLTRTLLPYRGLIWLGFSPQGLCSFDYFPLVPWFGFYLLGITFGHIAYKGGYRQFHLPDYSRNPFIKRIAFLGRHSLFVYMIHQPIIFGILRVTRLY
ncbi:DUF1624 domain-containing protein [bacterium]|jgi:uncharacterized membrane protein|nr:DUF1624 domain-containing protein [bacterium]